LGTISDEGLGWVYISIEACSHNEAMGVVGFCIFAVPDAFNGTVGIYKEIDGAARTAVLFGLCFVAEGTGQLGLVGGGFGVGGFAGRQDTGLLVPGQGRVGVAKRKRRAEQYEGGHNRGEESKEPEPDGIYRMSVLRVN